MSSDSKQPYFIFITGGVVSSLGKGIVASALAVLLQARGYRVRLRKLDPYLNPDPGTMNPTEHGEVYVTDDGCETDLDLGHYERFTDVPVKRSDNLTSGRVYLNLLQSERKGRYLGQTLQVVPHVTNDIKHFIRSDLADEDFVFYEIGGTIGDIESLPFLEAIRQFGVEVGRDKVAFIHVTLLPFLRAANELKTKPTQHSVRELRTAGIQPDVLVCRSEYPMTADIRKKIADMCSVNPNSVISAVDTAHTVYETPITYHDEGLDVCLINHFQCPPFALPQQTSQSNDTAQQTTTLEPDNRKHRRLELKKWHDIVDTFAKPEGKVDVALVAKYSNGIESYKSLVEAIIHAGIYHSQQVNIHWVDSENITQSSVDETLKRYDGVLIPGGFGKRGIEGKIQSAHYAHVHHKPFLGICLGMHSAIIAFARYTLGLPEANSSEFDVNGQTLVIDLIHEWLKGEVKEKRSRDSNMGGTMRLGKYSCLLRPHSRLKEIYNGQEIIYERHRHRYEVNRSYQSILEENGLIFSGVSPDGKLLEALEIPTHDWYFGVQYHPELLSRPYRPHPLYTSFVGAMISHSRLI